MTAHRIVKNPPGTKYVQLDIDDLLLAVSINGDFDIEGMSPAFFGLSSLYKAPAFLENISYFSGGFVNIQFNAVIEEPLITSYVESEELKIKVIEKDNSDYNITSFKANFANIDTLFRDRVVVFPTLFIEDLKQYLETPLENTKLIIYPIQSPNHYTLFILNPQNNQGYYFDSFGTNNHFFEQYCNKKGYQYDYNKTQLQFDGVACGPAIVNFAFHAINCIKHNKKITSEGMKEFSYNENKSERREVYDNMIQQQKNLLSKFPPALSFIISNIAFDYYLDKSKNRITGDKDQKFEFNFIEEKMHSEQSINKNSINNHQSNLYHFAITSFGVIIGGVLGYTITRPANINKVVSSFLVDNLKVTPSSANLIFSISSTVICAAILGVIAFTIGRYAVQQHLFQS